MVFLASVHALCCQLNSFCITIPSGCVMASSLKAVTHLPNKYCSFNANSFDFTNIVSFCIFLYSFSIGDPMSSQMLLLQAKDCMYNSHKRLIIFSFSLSRRNARNQEIRVTRCHNCEERSLRNVGHQKKM